MEKFNMEGLPQDIHHCTGRRDGEWMVWRCPHCPDYERRMNWETGEMRVKRGLSDALHAGAPAPGKGPSALAPAVFSIN